jgi:hypothetical protein
MYISFSCDRSHYQGIPTTISNLEGARLPQGCQGALGWPQKFLKTILGDFVYIFDSPNQF